MPRNKQKPRKQTTTQVVRFGYQNCCTTPKRTYGCDCKEYVDWIDEDDLGLKGVTLTDKNLSKFPLVSLEKHLFSSWNDDIPSKTK
jgi:hypothetical protein